MTSVSGSGISSSASPRFAEDMSVAYEGGKSFVDRLQEMSLAKERADKALAELALGTSARAAYNDADAKRQEAKEALEQAKQVVQEAQQKASQIIADATSHAADIVKDARARADGFIKDASDKNRAADEYHQKARSNADEILTRAKESQAAAARTMQEADHTLQRHQEAEIAAQNANGRASDLTARLHDAISALDEVLQRTREKIKL